MSWKPAARSRPARLRPSQDVLLGAVAVLITVAGSVTFGEHHHHPLPLLGYLLAVVAGGALAWLRGHTSTVLLVVFGVHLCASLVGLQYMPTYLPLIVAFFVTVVRGDRRVAYAVLAAGYAVAIGVPAMLTGARPDGTFALALVAWFLVLASAAEITRIRARARRAQTQEAARAGEALREQAARRAGEQRLRIAADLHDVLAHQLSLITVQANAGLATLRREPDRTADSLRAIKDAGNAALAELRTVLDALRTDQDAPRRPLPLVSHDSDLAGLLDGARDAGLTVHRDLRGRPRLLPIAVDQTGYRIVQEALTNAVRHAGPGTTATLLVEYLPEALHVVVTDDGAGTPQGGRGGGNGLPGMRARVAALGGRLQAAPDGAGFRVAAMLPVAEESP